ncbi:S49 family peptidase [Halosimplex rubrum]|uniref:S49 family peptidase n=1 Tax=Halosimplex rubrum TaxID=869889 RepID=A0A7D5TNV2_9EURY|nr:S49 family peptidase [Halosimplex rubrum]QLH77634.1 S49 family peptidase [Halosimplex rubrum]
MVDRTDSTKTTTVLYVIVVVVAVLIGTVLAPVVWSATQSSSGDSGDPTVSVITLRAGTDAGPVNDIKEDLRQARTNESVEAVVLRIDSPGGAVASSEEFYLAVNRTAAQMPVVAYVEGTAASGGYFGIAPADRIFVKPSSTVGSIGVIVSAPLSTVEQSEAQSKAYLRTGPDKATTEKDQLREQMETLHNAFVDTIVKHRGANLSMNRSGVAHGEAYIGPAALRNGFADEMGDLNSAIAEAATRADGIDGDQYNVDYNEPVSPSGGSIVLSEDPARVDGNVVYVDGSDDGGTEFQQPYEFHAVWGVPVTEDAPEVNNESE